MTTDFSVVNTSKVLPVAAREGAKPKLSMVVWDLFCERVKESELVKAIADAFANHRPSWFTAERDKGWESLDLAIRKECMHRGITLPTLRWVPTSTCTKTAQQKGRRIKKLELPLASDLLWFAAGSWDFDALVAQFTKMDGGIFVSANSSRKLDIPDAISLAYEQYMPRDLEREPEDAKAAHQRAEQAEEDYQRASREAMRDRMFGQSYTPPKPEPQPQTPAPAPYYPRRAPMGGGFATLPGNMRGKPQQR